MNILRGFNLLKAIFTFFKFWEFHNKYCIYIFPPLPSPFQFIPVPTFKFMTSSLVSIVPHIYSHVHIYDLLNPLSVAHVSMCLGLISWDWIMREWRKPRVNVCCWCGTAISWTPASDPWEKGKAYARPPGSHSERWQSLPGECWQCVQMSTLAPALLQRLLLLTSCLIGALPPYSAMCSSPLCSTL